MGYFLITEKIIPLSCVPELHSRHIPREVHIYFLKGTRGRRHSASDMQAHSSRVDILNAFHLLLPLHTPTAPTSALSLGGLS